jgi:hypothetical protein
MNALSVTVSTGQIKLGLIASVRFLKAALMMGASRHGYAGCQSGSCCRPYSKQRVILCLDASGTPLALLDALNPTVIIKVCLEVSRLLPAYLKDHSLTKIERAGKGMQRGKTNNA